MPGAVRRLIGAVLGAGSEGGTIPSTLSSRFDETVYLQTGDPAAAPIPGFDVTTDWTVTLWTKSKKVGESGVNQWVFGLGDDQDGWIRLIHVPAPVDLWLIGVGDTSAFYAIDTATTSEGYWDFAGVSNRYLLANALAPEIESKQAFTMLCAARLANTSSIGTAMSIFEDANFYHALQANTGTVVRATAAAGFISNSTTQQWTANTWHAFSSYYSIFTGGHLLSLLDGQADSPESTGVIVMFDVQGIHIAALANLGSFFPGDLAEIVIVQGVLTELEIREWAVGAAGGIKAAPLCSWATQADATGRILVYLPVVTDNKISTINEITTAFTDQNSGPVFSASGGPLVRRGTGSDDWHHWAIKHEVGTGISVAQDGNPYQFVFDTAGATSGESNERVLVGRALDSGGTPKWGFDGNVDEVTMWDTALPIASVVELVSFADPTTLPESADLVEFWRMGEAWTGSAIPGQEGTDDLDAAGGFSGSDLDSDVPP